MMSCVDWVQIKEIVGIICGAAVTIVIAWRLLR